MPTDRTSGVSLAEAFTQEHHEIDAAIEQYLAGGSDEEPLTRARPLAGALDALRRHIYLEEEIVFPRLPQGTLMMPLMVMRREHGELWRRMDDLSTTLLDPAADPVNIGQACTDILELLEVHNSKEEPIIYPYMDSGLEPDEQAVVRGMLAGASLPEGWVCQALR